MKHGKNHAFAKPDGVCVDVPVPVSPSRIFNNISET